MACCGISQIGGRPGGSSGGTVASSEWTERFLGDFAAAPVEDLADPTPPNPTVTVTNTTTTTGQVANCVWTSNAGDATPSVTQGTVTSFGTDGATGLVMEGALASTLFTEVSHQAPHIFCAWADLLNEQPRPGADYIIQVMFASEDLSFNGQAFGPGVYTPNDGAALPDIAGNPAIDDEKRIAGWLEQQSGNLGPLIREESTPFQQIFGSRPPANFDVLGLMFRGGSYAFGCVGVSAGGLFPEPEAMVMIPGPFLGGSITFPARPYLDPQERVAIAFQQQLSVAYDATVSAVRVLSRGG